MTIRYCLILLLFFVAPGLYAQLCQGSLGDPVVNITFGAGQNPGAQLSAATTSYGFVSFDCPNDGYYTVRNTTSNCFNGSWHSLTKDHTGDPNGYFMLVNASIEPADFYVDTVRGLCPNTTFEFASWIVNVLKSSACGGNGITPNLTFTIESTTGTILQTYNSGNIFADASPQWKQYGFFFKTGLDNDVVVRIRNNAMGGCGNDLALDDITFRPCGPQLTATINGEGATTDKSVCDYDNNSYTLKAGVSQGFTNPGYQWQLSTDNINWSDIPGANSITYVRKPTVIGTYYYRVASAEAGNINSVKCRIVSSPIIFRVEGRPATSTSSNSPVCEDAILSLNAQGGSTYAWTGPNNYTGSGSPATINNVQKNAAGKYYVTVSSVAGCTQKDSLVAAVVPKPVASAGADVAICAGSSTLLKGTGGGSYTWSPAAGLSATDISNPLASPADSTVYTLTVKDAVSGCIAVDSVAVFVSRPPTANAGPDKVIIEGESVQLTGMASGTSVAYAWLPAAYLNLDTILNPIASPPRDTTYTLRVTSQDGCGTAIDNVFVKVYKKVLIPNAFSPNNDGINDTWSIPALEAYPRAEVSVFNRNGQVVYTSKGSYTAWNGTYNNKDLPVGTYYYIIDVKVGLPKLRGWVAIIR